MLQVRVNACLAQLAKLAAQLLLPLAQEVVDISHHLELVSALKAVLVISPQIYISLSSNAPLALILAP